MFNIKWFSSHLDYGAIVLEVDSVYDEKCERKLAWFDE